MGVEQNGAVASVGLNLKSTNRTLPGLLVTGLLILMLMLALQLKLSHEAALDRATGDADNLAFTLDGQITATLRRIESSLNVIAEQLPDAALQAQAAERFRPQIDHMLAPHRHHFPEILGIFVWDADGNVLYDTVSSFPLKAPRSIAHRPGFQELKSKPQATIAFSDAIQSVMTGHPTVAVYVPVRRADGRLKAVVTATLNLDHIGQIFQSLHLGPRSVVFIRRSDSHRMVIRYPFKPSEINKPVRNGIQQRIDGGETAGRDRFKAVTDGEWRLYGFRKLADFPFYVVVGVAQADALGNWYRNAGAVGAVMLFMALALALALVRISRAEKLKRVAQQEAAKAHELLQEAINSISAGLIIYDEQDRLVMCNKAQLQIFNAIRDVLVPGTHFADILREGVRRGVFLGAVGQTDQWLVDAMAKHRASDGRPHEQALAGGLWVQITEHRTPSGYLVGSRIDITERKRLEHELRDLATVDTLTGLPNRRHFMSRLKEELERVQRGTTQQACVLMLDLDHFKRVNDTLGHAGGDRLLRHFADLLREQLRLSDSCGRLGGEEFAVVLPGSDLEAARHFAERLRRKLADTPIQIEGEEVRITVSIGLTPIRHADSTPDVILKRADEALYQAKAAGRNRVEAEVPI